MLINLTRAPKAPNRVRPDVREYINTELATEYEKRAAFQYAAALQGKIDASDNAEAINNSLMPVSKQWIVCTTFFREQGSSRWSQRPTRSKTSCERELSTPRTEHLPMPA